MTHSLKRSEALTDVQRARLDALYRIGKNCAHLQRIHLLGVTTVIGFLTPTSSVAGVTVRRERRWTSAGATAAGELDRSTAASHCVQRPAGETGRLFSTGWSLIAR